MNTRAGAGSHAGLPEAGEPVAGGDGILRQPPPGMRPDARSGKPGRRSGDFRFQSSARDFSDTQFFRRSVLVVGLTVAAGLVLAVIWFANTVFLVLFGSILLAVLLRAPTNWIARRTLLSQNVALMLSMLVLGAVFGLLIYMFAVPLTDQAVQLVNTLPRALAQFREWVRHYSWAAPLQSVLSELAGFKLSAEMIGRAGGAISTAIESLVGLVVMLFIGVYLAAQPRLYQRGFMHLLPEKARPRAREVMNEIGSVLRWWLLGRLITMLVVGIAAGIGLWWLNVPLAFTLATLSGLLEFIPYLGPILSAVPPLLIAFNVDPVLAFYVLLLYVAIQSAENYLLSPLIEQRTVALPPALVVFSTLLLGVLAGPLGVVLASPLTATCIVAIKRLYIEDVVEQAASK